MQISNDTLKAHLAEYEQEWRGLNSFITELKATTDKHGTPTEHFAEDLAEAKHNVVYYEGEIARIKKLLGQPSGVLSLSKEHIVGVVIVSSISFVAGWLLGSSLRGGR